MHSVTTVAEAGSGQPGPGIAAPGLFARGGDAGRIMKIALPVMGGSVIEALYNLTDAFFLGKLGTAEISAPSIAFSIVFFFVIFGTGLSGAGTTLVAQSRGKDDPARMNHYANQLASLLVLVAAVASILGVTLAAPVLRLLDTPAEVYGHALSYLGIVLTGLPFMFAYFALQASFTAIGDTVTPLLVHLGAVLLNVLLDPLLIFGLGPIPGMGVAGAAVATVLSQALGAILSIAVLARGKGPLRLTLRGMRPDRAAWGLLLRIGLPSGLGQAVSAFGFTIMQGVVNSFGTATIAAFGIGSRLFNMFDIPTFGVANATTALVGHAIGAKDPRAATRFVRSAMVMVVLLELPLLSLAMAFGGDLVRLFVNDPEVIRLGDIMFKVITPSLLMFSLYMALTGAFQGAGDTKIIMVLSIARLWVIRLPLAYLLAWTTDLGPYAIWIAMFVSNALITVVGFIHYRKGRWKRALDPDRI